MISFYTLDKIAKADLIASITIATFMTAVHNNDFLVLRDYKQDYLYNGVSPLSDIIDDDFDPSEIDYLLSSIPIIDKDQWIANCRVEDVLQLLSSPSAKSFVSQFINQQQVAFASH